jgi:predicted transcriptional regulator
MDLPQLKRKEISCYNPSDLWSQQDDLLFLKWVTNKRDRCYHTMSRDLSARQQLQQYQILWRRSKVMELSSQGYSQVEISKTLQISEPTISRDIDYLRSQSRQKIRKYIDETLPEEYEKCLVGITSILKEAWNISNNVEADKREKIHALSLAKECYSMKLELLTNATVVDDAMRFVEQGKEKLSKRQEYNNNQELKELEYNDDELEEEEKQEDEAGEISTATINQIF